MERLIGLADVASSARELAAVISMLSFNDRVVVKLVIFGVLVELEVPGVIRRSPRPFLGCNELKKSRVSVQSHASE